MPASARAALSIVVVLLVLAGCEAGSDSGSAAPDAADEVAGDADAEAAQVISDWADALRSGDVEAAAGFFAIPSTAENGPLLVRIESESDAVRFNESLPCGARLIRAEGSGEFTTATFELTERPGAGVCGPGTGQTAQTAFVIRDGEIVEWRRVGVDPTPPSGQAV